MKTVFIGGGAGCRDVLELFVQGRLSTLDLEILAVVDVNADAPGRAFAREQGWYTTDSIHEAMANPDLELVIELTGDEDVLDDVFFLLPPGVRLMDHVLARVFWDLDRIEDRLREQLRHKTVLEARVQEDRARLQEILDTVPDVVMVLDPEMRIVRVNRRFEEVARVSREDAKGRFCYEAFCKTDRLMRCAENDCPFMRVMESRSPVTMVQHDHRRAGRSGYYQITANPVFNDDGKIVRIVETSREITEQVMLKRETEESARRFMQIVDAVHAVITIKDADGRFLLANPRAQQMLGKSHDELVGRTTAEVLPAAAAEVIGRHDDEVLGGGGHHVAEETIVVDGKERNLICERFPLVDYKGDTVGLCCIARDDTRQREMQRELLLHERLAAVGKLAAGVAHELNNPLTGILTFAEDLLLEADEDDEVREDYEVIVNETMRCRRIVRDLLDFSRQQAPQRQAMDFNALAIRTVKMVERQASFHDIHFELDLEESVPLVQVDPNLVQQAILNLVINARDAMDRRGEIGLSSATVRGGQAVRLSVSDTGCGIAQEALERIFEPFFSTKGEQGNGLGLPAVMSVADQHGGKVDVDSEVGVGTTFHLTLPAAGGTIGAKR